MTTRAAAAEATRERIAEAASVAFTTRWYDDVTLRDVAAEAGVALQTVANHFGTKDDLFAAAFDHFHASIVAAREAVTPGDVEGAVTALVDDYEQTGDAILRFLAVEEHVPAVAPQVERGREQIVLGSEVVRHRLERHAGLGGHVAQLSLIHI